MFAFNGAKIIQTNGLNFMYVCIIVSEFCQFISNIIKIKSNLNKTNKTFLHFITLNNTYLVFQRYSVIGNDYSLSWWLFN